MIRRNKTHPESSDISPILTKQEAADYIKTSTRFIERQVRLGRLKAYKPTGGLFRVRIADLNAFLESGASVAEPPQAGSAREGIAYE